MPRQAEPDVLRSIHARSDAGGFPAAVHARHGRGLPVFHAARGHESARRRAVVPAVADASAADFWPFTMRLSPARRVLYGFALVATLLGSLMLFRGFGPVAGPALSVQDHDARCRSGRTAALWLFVGFIALNLLILMEVADRLSLKGDLEIARDIQLAMLPGGTLPRGRRRRLRRDASGEHRRRRFLRHPGASRRTARARAWRRRGQGQSRGAAHGPAARDAAHARGRRARDVASGRATERAGGAAQPALAFHHALLWRLRSARRVAQLRERRPSSAGGPPRGRHDSNRSGTRRAAGSRSACSSSATYTPSAERIAPGDLLVLYSDGITEAENAPGKPFDESGLETVISDNADKEPEAVGRALLKRVEAYAADARLGTI